MPPCVISRSSFSVSYSPLCWRASACFIAWAALLSTSGAEVELRSHVTKTCRPTRKNTHQTRRDGERLTVRRGMAHDREGRAHRAQRLGRDLLAVVALEEAAMPTAPRRRLERSVRNRLRWVKEIRGLDRRRGQLEHGAVLVEDGRERRRERRGKRPVELGRLVAIASL